VVRAAGDAGACRAAPVIWLGAGTMRGCQSRDAGMRVYDGQRLSGLDSGGLTSIGRGGAEGGLARVRAEAWGAKAADRKNGYEVKRALCGMRGERIKKAGMKFLKMTVKSMNVRDYVHQLRIYSSISVPRNISQLYSLVPVPRKIKTGMYIFCSSEVQED
jgi:hypothetical protein